VKSSWVNTRAFFGVAASKMTVVHNGLDHARIGDRTGLALVGRLC